MIKKIIGEERDNNWLKSRFLNIWKDHFNDVKVVEPVTIRFSRPSKFRFGSIRLVKKNIFSKGESRILINGNFSKKSIPIEIVNYTIAHELVHYAHGFSSSLPRFHRYPHHGGVVDQELAKRGMDKTVRFYKIWLKNYRAEIRLRRRIWAR